MGSLVGQSEERTRQALHGIDAMIPRFAMIDEIEKAFLGVGGTGDSGVASRMFGTFLSWLNEHDFPSVEPPPYLQQLSPQLYQQECQRMQSRFDEAVQLAEQAFLEELARLVEHLTERLAGTDDGKPKVFRDSAISNLTEFFERFRQLNVRSNPELDELVASAQRVVRGLEPQRLRDSSSLRQQVTTQMAAVQADLDQLLVERPRRNIQRRPR